MAVGAAGEPLIAYSHGPPFMDDPNTRLGKHGRATPSRRRSPRRPRARGLRFIVNAVLDDEERVVGVMAGEPAETHARLVEFARSIYEVPIPAPVRRGDRRGGLSQGRQPLPGQPGRAYLYFGPTPVVRPGGIYHHAARAARRGRARGWASSASSRAMRDAPDVQSILDDARRTATRPASSAPL